MLASIFLFLSSYGFAGSPGGIQPDSETANVHWIVPTAAPFTETSYIVLTTGTSNLSFMLLLVGAIGFGLVLLYLKLK